MDGSPQPSLFDTNKKAFADSVLKAHANLDWVKRLYEPNAPTLQVPGQPDLSTHFMGDDGKGYVYPTVVRKPGEKNLTFLGKPIKDPKTGKISYNTDAAYDYAKATGTGIQLPAAQGTWFAANGYKAAPNVLNNIANGTPVNNPNLDVDANGNIFQHQPVQQWPPLPLPPMQQDNTKVATYKKIVQQ